MNESYQQTETEDKLTGIVKPLIYSKRAVYGCAVLFSSLFGGILLMQNLRDTGRMKEANIVLGVSVLLTAATIFIANMTQGRSVVLICSIGGAALLSEYFFKKYFPNEAEYGKKKIWKPLIIGLAITAIFIFFIFWGQGQVA